MKKLLGIMFLFAVLLVGCGSENVSNVESKEIENDFPMNIEDFVDVYNDNIDTLNDSGTLEEVPSKIDLANAEPFKKDEENLYTGLLITEDDNGNAYGIHASLDKDNNLKGISVNNELTPKGVASTVVILDSLGLDRTKVNDFFEGDVSEITYTENQYSIRLSVDYDTGTFIAWIETE